MEQYFQHVDQKVIHDKDLEYFAANFAKNNYTKTNPATMLRYYIFWNTFYGKPYWFDENMG